MENIRSLILNQKCKCGNKVKYQCIKCKIKICDDIKCGSNTVDGYMCGIYTENGCITIYDECYKCKDKIGILDSNLFFCFDCANNFCQKCSNNNECKKCNRDICDDCLITHGK
jgi:hypothetical protein